MPPTGLCPRRHRDRCSVCRRACRGDGGAGYPAFIRRQCGTSLLIVLLLLAVIMLLGVSAAQIALMAEKSSRNARNRHIAFEAAEAALQDAALDLASARVNPAAFPEQLGRCHDNGPHAGLCRSSAALAAWQPAAVLSSTAPVEYGRFTGRLFPYGLASLAAQPPRYLIESIPPAQQCAASTCTRYRITAIGYGPDAAASVILQTWHALDGVGALPQNGRRSWREIVR